MDVEDLGEGLRGPRPLKGQKHTLQQQQGLSDGQQAAKKSKKMAAKEESGSDDEEGFDRAGTSLQSRLAKAHANGAAAAALKAASEGSAKSKAGQVPFVASPKFAGARPGYCFRKGAQGLGYYVDKPPQVIVTHVYTCMHCCGKAWSVACNEKVVSSCVWCLLSLARLLHSLMSVWLIFPSTRRSLVLPCYSKQHVAKAPSFH